MDYWCWDMAGFGPGGPGGGSDTAAAATANTAVPEEIESDDDGYLMEALRRSMKDTVYAQVRTCNINGMDAGATIEHATPWWRSALTGVEVGTGIATAALVGLYIADTVRGDKASAGKKAVAAGDGTQKKGGEA